MKKYADKSFVVRVAVFALPLFLLVMNGAVFAQAPASLEKAAPPIFWFVIVMVTLFVVVFMFAILRGLLSSKDWTLAEALSEEADPQPTPAPDKKPIMVASSSRLIALLGLFVILSLFLGVGYYILWCLFTNSQMTNLKDVTSYFYAGVVLFAPYIVNKFSDAFSVFKPTH